MLEYFRGLFGGNSFAPHGYCLLWQPELIWTHVVSDALIGLAYFSIPIAIAYFLTKRRDVSFGWVIWMFATFIMFCGVTHFMGIWTLWNPDYGTQALIKLATAIVSVFTAVALWPLLPRAIALPSPRMLQAANEDLRLRIAERDEAVTALERERAEREKTEEMLRQAQKMEAVGQLTGGIAHDFNNLLQVVIGNLDRAQRMAGTGGTDKDGAIARALANAQRGAERAAALTDQLLSFSRKQPLRPEAQDLNALVTSMADLVARTIGPDVRVETRLAGDLWPTHVDANQTENAILNLVVNARDAMEGSGALTILTYNAPAGTPLGDQSVDGDHVVLEVADSGAGMDEETVSRVFEPFFTTKPIGKGTGLGLSQVYGFIKQSSGLIQVDSEIGEGTRIRLLLPRAAG